MRSFSWLALSSLLAACGGPMNYERQGTSDAPGADARIEAEVSADQRQTQVNVEIEHLAPPGRVGEGAASYVAWYRRDAGETWRRIGALSYDSEERKGTLNGSVPEVSFDLQVTAEPAANVAAPSSEVVVTQRVEED